MLGSNVRTCIHSEWTGNKPICSGLNQENDYASKRNKRLCDLYRYSLYNYFNVAPFRPDNYFIFRFRPVHTVIHTYNVYKKALEMCI